MIPIVMCIDDDAMVHLLCNLIFKETGFCQDLIVCANGEEALSYFNRELGKDMAQRQWPDLIFLDINMPILDGWGFLEAYIDNFAPKRPQTRVMMLSSTVDPNDRLRALLYGIVLDFLEKPVSKKMVSNLKMHPDLAHFFI